MSLWTALIISIYFKVRVGSKKTKKNFKNLGWGEQPQTGGSGPPGPSVEPHLQDSWAIRCYCCWKFIKVYTGWAEKVSPKQFTFMMSITRHKNTDILHVDLITAHYIKLFCWSVLLYSMVLSKPWHKLGRVSHLLYSFHVLKFVQQVRFKMKT